MSRWREKGLFDHQVVFVEIVSTCKKGSNVAQHIWNNDQRIYINQAKVIDKGNFRERKTL